MKKVLSIVLSVALLLSLSIQVGRTPVHAATISFSDIQGHWAESSINNAVTQGYVNGYTDGSFRPENSLTRAEFMKMLVAALGLETKTGGSEKWYKPYVDAAIAEGIYKKGDFANEAYEKSLTRAEMATVVVRATGVKDVEPKQGLYLATSKGLIGGTSPGEISADGFSTRAQAIVVIERMLSVNAGKQLPVDKYAVAAAEIYWHRTNIYTVAPELFNQGGTSVPFTDINYWNESRLTLTSRDGNYKAELEELVAIDLSDPKDPNRKLLPPIDKLYFEYFIEEEKKYKTEKLKEISDYYIIVLKSKLIHKNNKSYLDDMFFNIYGFDRTQDKISGNNLYLIRDDKSSEHTGMKIISKNFKLELTKNNMNGKMYGRVMGFLDTPGGGGSFNRQQIISSFVYEE
ncbi:S-layer homology domain-containing protein [Paenibacillus sp. FSL W7-1287]|uniref:S-layer homology domain-containing protein n=1 Tax=Paenibacillus sp. FSL W7-1287 TaxID=2954538 RepID=UPI0030F8CD3A